MSCRSLTAQLSVLAAGLTCGLPDAAQANPGMSDPDCLRPPAALLSTGSPVLIPPGAGRSELVVQPPSTWAGVGENSPRLTSQVLDSSPQQAQAGVPESLPACTYDPPLPPAPGVIRGLW